jgi:hypothetical protein
MRERLLLAVFSVLGVLASGCDPILPPPADAGAGPGGPLACGPTTCRPGFVCCNSSCGICTPPDGVCIQLACENPCNLADCADNTTCKVVNGEATCVPVEPEITCASVLCIVGTFCEETPNGPQCVPADAGVVNPPLTCASVLCIVGTTCEETPNGPQCVPTATDAGPGPSTCAVTLCPVGTYCDDITGTAQCIKAPSCRGHSCPRGQHCELQEVQCIRAPCPPFPGCVPDDEPPVKDPCATVRCKAGTHCEVTPIVCITTPCDPIAECVPDVTGGSCGGNTCSAGQFCCNPSCGICAPKGGACTQQFCGEP